MAKWRMLPGATFGFTLAGTPAERFHVQRFDGVERISQLYRYEIDVIDTDEAPVLADLLDGNAALTIDPQKSAEIVHVGARRIGGLIADAQLLGRREDGFQVRLTLVPRLWLLTRSRRCRVFMKEQQTIIDVIQEVLRPYGMQAGRDFAVSNLRAADYPKRPYLVQYHESDWDFLCRWLEHEGIFFAFEQTTQGEKLVLMDNKDHYAPLVDNEHTLTYQPAAGNDFTRSRLAFSLTHRVGRVQHHVVLQDYNSAAPVWRDPAGGLLVSKQTLAGKGGQPPKSYEHVPLVHHEPDTRYDTRQQGTWLATRRAEHFDAEEEQLTGESSCTDFRPTMQMKTAGCQRFGLPQSAFVLIDVEHHGVADHGDAAGKGALAEYGNRFRAIPATRTWRPARLTPWPAINGVMHAVIDGATCDHDAAANSSLDPYAIAEVNERGEYRVRLPFDLAERKKGEAASCWIRMAQPLAGDNYGLHFPLHVGTEVIIAHIGGDPDRPVIIGAVTNKDALAPVTQGNSHKNVLRSPSGNRVELDDQYNAQRIYLENGKATAFDMLGRDFTAADAATSAPSAQNAGGGAAPAPAGIGSAQYAAAAPVASSPTQGGSSSYNAPANNDSNDDDKPLWDAGGYPDPRFWDHAAIAHQVTGLDLGDDRPAYVGADFTSIFRVFDREKYKQTTTAPAHDNHTKRKDGYDPAAKLAKRDSKTLEEQLVYVEESDADKANPAFQCYRFSGSIGWQRLNVGPEVAIQYGRVHRKTMGDVTEYHSGDAVTIHEAGDRYVFTAKTNSFEWGEGNRFRYGGGFESHDTLKTDLKRESFASLALDQDVAYNRKHVDGSHHHERAIATDLYESALSTKHAVDYRKATNLHVTWTESPKVYHVVDGDRFDDTTGDCWTHVEKNHLHAVKEIYALTAGKANVQVQDAFAAKAGKLMLEAGTLVIKQSAGAAGTAPGSGSKGDASSLKGTAADLVANASDLTGAAGAQKGDGTTALDGSEMSAPSTSVSASAPSVSGSGLLIDAVQAEIKTSAALKIKAGSTADLEATGPLGLKGALVKIEGSGPVQIKGAIIQLG
ncbi:MAG: type VI secretion system tip protein VgrG [Planctomycetes bacterium]|nr:type VI secretion system tip protein VgrG [Planctomycetota bacterium]